MRQKTVETDCSAQGVDTELRNNPSVFSQKGPPPWFEVTCSHLLIFLSGAHVHPVALPEIHGEVLFLGRATQPVVAQPQVLELWGWPSTQILQITHSIVAELQDLPRAEGTTNTLEMSCSGTPSSCLASTVFPHGNCCPILHKALLTHLQSPGQVG